MTKREKATKLAEIMNQMQPSVNVTRMAKRLHNNMTEREIEKAISYLKITHNL